MITIRCERCRRLANERYFRVRRSRSGGIKAWVDEILSRGVRAGIRFRAEAAAEEARVAARKKRHAARKKARKELMDSRAPAGVGDE